MSQDQGSTGAAKGVSVPAPGAAPAPAAPKPPEAKPIPAPAAPKPPGATPAAAPKSPEAKSAADASADPKKEGGGKKEEPEKELSDKEQLDKELGEFDAFIQDNFSELSAEDKQALLDELELMQAERLGMKQGASQATSVSESVAGVSSGHSKERSSEKGSGRLGVSFNSSGDPKIRFSNGEIIQPVQLNKKMREEMQGASNRYEKLKPKEEVPHPAKAEHDTLKESSENLGKTHNELTKRALVECALDRIKEKNGLTDGLGEARELNDKALTTAKDTLHAKDKVYNEALGAFNGKCQTIEQKRSMDSMVVGVTGEHPPVGSETNIPPPQTSPGQNPALASAKSSSPPGGH